MRELITTTTDDSSNSETAIKELVMQIITILQKSLGQVQTRVSDEDADLALQRWHLSGGHTKSGSYFATMGTLYGAPRTSKIYMHRVIAQRMGLIDQVFLNGLGRSIPNIDHIDGDKFNNQRDNLRLATHSQQQLNPNDALRKTNTTGYRGVSWDAAMAKYGKPFRATILHNGVSKYLGCYETTELANEARQEFITSRG